tara:strand:+ start:2023 stop:2439 length:417 start_codon:yes stop_codon:yes gene_type:complete
MSEVIISIKPIYVDKIFEGVKSVELRKRVGARFNQGTRLFIYCSSPVKKITGWAEISQVETLDVATIRSRFLKEACISEVDFEEYYRGHDQGVVIRLCNVNQFREGIPLNILRSYGFCPPQSYCYLKKEVSEVLGECL